MRNRLHHRRSVVPGGPHAENGQAGGPGHRPRRVVARPSGLLSCLIFPIIAVIYIAVALFQLRGLSGYMSARADSPRRPLRLRSPSRSELHVQLCHRSKYSQLGATRAEIDKGWDNMAAEEELFRIFPGVSAHRHQLLHGR